MKFDNKKKLIIIVLAGIVVLTLVGIVGALSGWFGKGTSGFSSTLLPEWKYRRPITLSGQTRALDKLFGFAKLKLVNPPCAYFGRCRVFIYGK